MKIKEARSTGFTMIVLLISVILVLLLTFYAYRKTLNRVNDATKEANPEMNVPTPTLQNYQQTLDNVKKNLNENVQKEQQRLNNTQEETK